MAFNDFLKAVMVHQPKGILKYKIAKWILSELKENGKLTFKELYNKLKERTDFSPKLLRKVLRILRDLNIIRLTTKHTETQVYAYEIDKYFVDFLRNIERDFYKSYC
jgi:DNA-binding HxlR family transcriptional regulator